MQPRMPRGRGARDEVGHSHALVAPRADQARLWERHRPWEFRRLADVSAPHGFAGNASHCRCGAEWYALVAWQMDQRSASPSSTSTRAIARGEPAGVRCLASARRPALASGRGDAAPWADGWTLVTDGTKHIQAWDGARVIDHLAAGRNTPSSCRPMAGPCHGMIRARTMLGIVRHPEFTRYAVELPPRGRGPGERARSLVPPPRAADAGWHLRAGAGARCASWPAADSPGGARAAVDRAAPRAELAHAERVLPAVIARAPPGTRSRSMCISTSAKDSSARDESGAALPAPSPPTSRCLFSKIGGEAFGAYLTRLRQPGARGPAPAAGAAGE